MRNYLKVLFIIFLLGGFLRLYKLESYPPSIYWDEAAIGYNAYSIAQTGRDEYGVSHPILFKSFNDFKLPGYIYTDTIFVKLFGLSPTTTRLPSALFGALAPIAVFLIARKLFDEKTALIAAFFLAISPWHLQFSRAAFEATISFTLILFGIVFLIYGQKNKLMIPLAAVTFSLSLYFYLAARVIVPLIILSFILINLKKQRGNLNSYIIGFALAILISTPILLSAFSSSGLKHLKEVSLFEDRTLLNTYVEAGANDKNPLSKIFLNRRVPYMFESLHKYFSHYSPGFLFFGDDPNPRHHPPFQGNLYLYEIILLPLGFWNLLKAKNNQTKFFILSIFLISPIPAAFSKESPHSLRTMLMLLPLVLTSALGASYILKYILKKTGAKLIFAAIIILFFINYLYTYYKLYPIRDSAAWAYGYQQMTREVSKIQEDYDRIIVTGYYWKPYIYYLFFNNIDPEVYQKNPDIQLIGKYRFGTTFWDSGGKNLDEETIDQLLDKKTLVVLSPQEFLALKNKDRFKQLLSVNDYSNRNSIFLIGEWN
ncbi:MAG: glycosyltransferase family 39 protein [Candidatus Curtissbacteria bacterium]|nr:glycosyltransferase family 39 protein [Candidatus Curtissbacteria bacterium]